LDEPLPNRLGIFGGTFDPPHIGHLILAEEALHQLHLDCILWVLTPDPPHKTGQEITQLDHRTEMLKLALAEAPQFALSYVDIQRPPPHYAVDTMQLLRIEYPHARLVYLMGGDSLSDLPTWMRPEEFIQSCDEIGVMLRPGREVDLHSLDRALPGIEDKVRFIQAPLLEISSSILRAKIALHGPYRYYLLPPVHDYIERCQLYGR
jgi:nicotinate-nucleotide adenylyltransferase